MASSDYWRKREEEALKHYIKQEAEYDKEIKRIYQNQLDEIQKEIEAFYGKYAKAENITLAEAKKRVGQLDIAAYERKAAKYVKDKDFSARANEEMRLYNLTMKVNRLEMLKANIGLELIAGHEELDKFMGGILRGRTEEELKRQAGILGKSVRNNAQKANAIPNASFHNATFSDRIWMYQDAMKADLSKLLQSGLIQGKNPRVLARELQKNFNVSTANAERLMRTELARVQTEAQKQSFIRNGFEEYEFIANSGCCDVCQGMNGKHFKVKDMMPGKNAAPMHPHCRCSTAAYEDNDEYEAWLNYLESGGTTQMWNMLKATNTKKSQNKNTSRKAINKTVNIAGVDCVVGREKYGFGDGYGGIKKTIDAVTYTLPDGIKFVWPKTYKKEQQKLTPEQAISNWMKVPESIRKQAQKTIEVVDYYNPADTYWRKHYKNFGHSYATGGDKITFYRHDYDHDDDYLVQTYCHEVGHFIDTNKATTEKRFSYESMWTNAMSSDKMVSGKDSCTDYGKNDPAEDFAESIAMYSRDKNEFKKDFPNRSDILSDIV
ncbi:MAG: minor capsid protein [Christensenellales bacterium]